MKTERRKKGQVEKGLEELRPKVAEFGQASCSSMNDEEASQPTTQPKRYTIDSIPFPVLEEDYLQLRRDIDRVRAEGTGNFSEYLRNNTMFVRKAGGLIRITDVNREALKLFGATRKEELLGHTSQVYHNMPSEALQAQLLALAEGQSLFELESSIECINGTTKTVLMRKTVLSDPAQRGRMLVALFDITDRIGSSEAIRKSEERFRAIFDAASDCIYTKDLDLKFTAANPALLAMLNLTTADLVGCTAADLYGDEAGKHIHEVDRRVLLGHPVEEEHTRPVNGVPRTFHDIRFPLRNSGGEIDGIFGISRDITERVTAIRPPQISESDYPAPAMQSALSKARYAAATDSVILLLGESGCGKDRMARYIHAHSRRNKGPFFSINCAALSHDIAESELFGHEAGAFTGARARKRGLLELAEGGTLLLNEIGELSLGMQSKLLTFLDSNSFTRLGGEKTITVNARLIAATHRDLKSEVAAARFLPALFYRLDVISIRIPSLRDRIEDLPLLVEEIVSALMTEKHFPQGRSPDPKMLLQLANYDWPGNIRELRNLIERWLILADSDHLDFPALGNDSTEDNWKFKLRFPRETSLAAIRGQITRLLCMEALSRAKGNKKEAAKLLGISRYSFYRHLKGVEVECDKLT